MSRLLIMCVFLVCCSLSAPIWAVIVFQKNQDEPIRGFLVHEDGTHIEVHEPLPSGEVRKHTLPRVAIEDMLRAIEPERLMALKPESPEDYRSYAEELAGKTEDPEARVMAIRLYLIATYLEPDELGRSCLLGMAGLARNPAEERSFRAMAFSLDPDHDPALLKPPKATVAEFTGIKESDRQALRAALQLLRSGRLDESRRYFQRPPVQAAKAYYSHVISDEDYAEAIRLAGRLTPRLLRKFLTLDLVLSAAATEVSTDDTPRYDPWSLLVARNDTEPITPQSLLTITEFDPRQTIYRDGKWVTAVE